nr:MAG TPA: hypothetical protein [Caudoviricetes sp.]
MVVSGHFLSRSKNIQNSVCTIYKITKATISHKNPV